MNIDLQRIVLLIILIGAASLVLVSFSLSSYGSFMGFSTSRTFVFIMINIVISFVLVKSLGQSAEGHDEVFPLGDSDPEAAEEKIEEMIDSSSSSSGNGDDYFDYYNSDGYEEDHDDSDSNDGISWDSENEGCDDDHLESRIEEFIAKVIQGWKEELLAYRLNSQQVD